MKILEKRDFLFLLNLVVFIVALAIVACEIK